MLPEDGAASGVYTRAVEELSLSLARNNAAIIELNGEDAALVRCALDSAKLYFRSRKPNPAWDTSDWINLSGYATAPNKDMYYYRAGRYRCLNFLYRSRFQRNVIDISAFISSAYTFSHVRRSPEGASLEPPPPCMPEVFRCVGKASRAALSAVAHYLRLRGE